MVGSNINPSTPDRLIRLREVLHLTGLSRSGLYRLVGQGRFPPQIKIGHFASAWLSSEVVSWIASRVAASRGTEVA